jgi:hypothetical protein
MTRMESCDGKQRWVIVKPRVFIWPSGLFSLVSDMLSLVVDSLLLPMMEISS